MREPTPAIENPDLANLQGLADQVDGQATAVENPAADPAAAPAVIDYAQEATGLTEMVAGLITGYCPAAGPLWSEEKKRMVAAAVAPVMQKYNFSLGAMPCELTLLIVAGPLVYQSARMLAMQMNQDKAQAAQAAKPAAPPTPGDPATTPTHNPDMMALKV